MDIDGDAEGGGKRDGTEVCLEFDWEDPSAICARKRTLVGRFVTEKALNRNTVRAMIVKAWNMQKGLDILEISENCYRFSFDRKEDCCRILKGRPWMILGCLLILEWWQPMLTLGEIGLHFSPYWNHLHDLPLEVFAVKNILRIGGVFGEVLAVEDPYS